MTSLRARLLALLLLSMCVLAALIGSITYLQTLRENERLFDHQLRQTALTLRDQGVAETAQADIYAEEPLDIVVKIWEPDGRIVYQSHPGTMLPSSATLGFRTAYAGGTLWRVYTMPTLKRVIQVAQSESGRNRLAGLTALRSLSPLFAFAPLMGGVIWWLVGREFRAVRRLEREVRRRHAHSLDAVSEEGLPSEIAPVVTALNALLKRLHRAFGAQRAFIGDAAHELRSPVTALMLQIDVLEAAGSERQRKEALRELRAGVERANRLIGQLLTAARTEPDDASAQFADVSLAEIARRVIAECHDEAQARNIGIEFDADTGALLHGDALQLRALVRNLADNAVRYTPDDGRVAIALHEAAGTLVLKVDDTGPGIPKPERAQVFRRFYRCNADGQSGSGLGLAIVRNVALQHGAKVILRDSTLGGLGVDVIFPPHAVRNAQPTAAASGADSRLRESAP